VTPAQAIAFVRRHGIVLLAGRGPVPSLADAIAGEPIRGSWWGHAKGQEIFLASEALAEHPAVLVCKLVNGKVTFVHRRLWPALVRLAPRLGKPALARAWQEHTPSGAHRSRRVAFPRWVPEDVARRAERMPLDRAERELSLVLGQPPRPRARSRKA